mmetsp:Transcript_30379/g.48720  ORF Transcript_30379/g.48720 Transcript_30379/m.48720 type:complete len:82 (+) Transcript_30379:570-815(+)
MELQDTEAETTYLEFKFGDHNLTITTNIKKAQIHTPRMLEDNMIPSFASEDLLELDIHTGNLDDSMSLGSKADNLPHAQMI